MKFNSQICTTKEQSERLLALGLKKETADMYHYVTSNGAGISAMDDDFLPHMDTLAWSLHRLIEMIPITVPDKSGITHFFSIYETGYISYIYFGEESWEIWKSWNQKELYDSIIDCIVWLIKEGYFNKEYLEK